MMTENIQSLLWRLWPGLTESTVICLDWFNEQRKERDIWGKWHMENPEQYVFLQYTHERKNKTNIHTQLPTTQTANIMILKHTTKMQKYSTHLFKDFLAIKSSQKSSITLLFMMARRHIIQTWMSSLASPMLSLATCRERLRTPGLSNTSNDGRR